MKILTVVFLMTTTFAFCQQSKFNFGPKLGINISTVSNQLEESKARVGLNIGAFASYDFSDKIAAQLEGNYSSQGAKFVSYYKSKLALEYFTIPLLMNYNVNDFCTIDFGPQIGLLMHAKFKTETEDHKINSITRNTDFGLNLGASFTFEERVLLGMRYYYGMQDILVQSEDPWKNGVLQFYVGYKIK